MKKIIDNDSITTREITIEVPETWVNENWENGKNRRFSINVPVKRIDMEPMMENIKKCLEHNDMDPKQIDRIQNGFWELVDEETQIAILREIINR